MHVVSHPPLVTPGVGWHGGSTRGLLGGCIYRDRAEDFLSVGVAKISKYVGKVRKIAPKRSNLTGSLAIDGCRW